MISYGLSDYSSHHRYIGLYVDHECVAWLYPRGNPTTFDVVDETSGPNMGERFETLAGADVRMWEIARRERSRLRKAQRDQIHHE